MKDNAAADELRDEGNKSYQQKKFYEALILYNKSLCHAMPGSSQLGLAYANRSAVYLELKQFDKCLANVQLARGNCYPYETKLKEREEKCNKLTKTQKGDKRNNPWSYFKLSYPPNEKIPFIVDCIELKTDEKYGRHIVTSRDLLPGDVIAIEKPIFPNIGKSAIYIRCTFCLKSNLLNLIPCHRNSDSNTCTTAMFCSQECLDKSHATFHGVVCERLDAIWEQDEHEAVETIYTWKGLTESLYVVQDRAELLQDLMDSNNRTTIFDLDLANEQDDFKYLSFINSLDAHSLFGDEKFYKEVSSDFVTTTLRPLKAETVPILVEYSTRLAMIRYRHSLPITQRHSTASMTLLPFGSLYSHSCDANIFLVHIDDKIVHVVTKPISKGEQLFICYGIHYNNVPSQYERQKCIMEDHNFKCSCVPCTYGCHGVMSFPPFDPHFIRPNTNVCPDSIGELMAELPKHFEYIKNNFSNYPTTELFSSGWFCERNLALVADKAAWPF